MWEGEKCIGQTNFYQINNNYCKYKLLYIVLLPWFVDGDNSSGFSKTPFSLNKNTAKLIHTYVMHNINQAYT